MAAGSAVALLKTMKRKTPPVLAPSEVMPPVAADQVDARQPRADATLTILTPPAGMGSPAGRAGRERGAEGAGMRAGCPVGNGRR